MFKGYWSGFLAPPYFFDESYRKKSCKYAFWQLLVDFGREQAREFSQQFVMSFLGRWHRVFSWQPTRPASRKKSPSRSIRPGCYGGKTSQIEVSSLNTNFAMSKLLRDWLAGLRLVQAQQKYEQVEISFLDTNFAMLPIALVRVGREGWLWI